MSNSQGPIVQKIIAMLRMPLEERALREIPEIAAMVKNADMKQCKEAISQLKALIKSERTEVYHKLLCLRCHHACMMEDNTNYIVFSGKKMNKMTSRLARHKKEYQDPERGADIFGFISGKTYISKQSSVVFLQFLLNCIRIWGNTYATQPNGKPSVFYTQLSKLLNERVTFPDERRVEEMMSLHQDANPLLYNPAAGPNPVARNPAAYGQAHHVPRQQASRKSVAEILAGVDEQCMMVIEMATNPEAEQMILAEFLEELKRRQLTIQRYTSSYNEVVEAEELSALLEAADQVETAVTVAQDVLNASMPPMAPQE